MDMIFRRKLISEVQSEDPTQLPAVEPHLPLGSICSLRDAVTASGVFGVDPGLDGAIAFIREDGTAWAQLTPVFSAGSGGRREFDIAGMRALLTKETAALAIIEAASARPGQGVTSMFRFGQGHGIWLGMLAALRIPHEVVQSQTWKRVVLAGRSHDKAGALGYCERRFPRVPLLATPRSTKPHDGLADALCLAEWGRRLLAGEKTT